MPITLIESDATRYPSCADSVAATQAHAAVAPDHWRNDATRTAIVGIPASMRGLSLVELMIALLISTLILAGLVQIFASTRSTYQTDEGLARIQENGRFAMDFLTRDLRTAGYMGCISLNDENLRVYNFLKPSGSGTPYDLSIGIQGYEYTGTGPADTYSTGTLYPTAPLGSSTSPALEATLSAAVVAKGKGIVPGSDVIVVRHMVGDTAATLEPPYNDSAQIFAGTGTEKVIKTGNVVMLTDCKKLAIFQATNVNVSGGKVNIVHSLDGKQVPGNRCSVWGISGDCKMETDQVQFQAGSFFSTFESVAYFIGRGTSGSPSLYRVRFNGASATEPEELVEGIENMQALYGVDSDNDPSHGPDTYLTASNVTDWKRVVSVRLGILASSTNVVGNMETGADTMQHKVVGLTLIPGSDNHRRRVFTSTVDLRYINSEDPDAP